MVQQPEGARGFLPPEADLPSAESSPTVLIQVHLTGKLSPGGDSDHDSARIEAGLDRLISLGYRAAVGTTAEPIGFGLEILRRSPWPQLCLSREIPLLDLDSSPMERRNLPGFGPIWLPGPVMGSDWILLTRAGSEPEELLTILPGSQRLRLMARVRQSSQLRRMGEELARQLPRVIRSAPGGERGDLRPPRAFLGFLMLRRSRAVRPVLIPHRCVRCGSCVLRCPVGAIRMEDRPHRGPECVHCMLCCRICIPAAWMRTCGLLHGRRIAPELPGFGPWDRAQSLIDQPGWPPGSEDEP